MLAVDASFALKLFLNEPESQRVRQLWQDWTDAGEVIIGPTLFRAETFSVVRRHWHMGALAEPAAERAFHYFDNLAIEIHEPTDLYRTAWEFASRFNRRQSMIAATWRSRPSSAVISGPQTSA